LYSSNEEAFAGGIRGPHGNGGLLGSGTVDLGREGLQSDRLEYFVRSVAKGGLVRGDRNVAMLVLLVLTSKIYTQSA
jgi:hypothetical protein